MFAAKANRFIYKKTKKKQQKPPAGKEVGSHHGVVPHVAGLADGLVLLHDVRLPGEDTVALEAAEVLQVPVLALGLRVLVAEDQLRTRKRGTSAQPNPTCASCSLKANPPPPPPRPPHLVAAAAARLLAVAVVAAAVHLALLPEVDHVHQQLLAGAAHEAGRVPQLVVAGPLGVDGRLAAGHRLLAVVARLAGDRRGGERETVG